MEMFQFNPVSGTHRCYTKTRIHQRAEATFRRMTGCRRCDGNTKEQVWFKAMSHHICYPHIPNPPHLTLC